MVEPLCKSIETNLFYTPSVKEQFVSALKETSDRSNQLPTTLLQMLSTLYASLRTVIALLKSP